MRDLVEIAADFPAEPDWLWLGWFWEPVGLLNRRARLAEVAADAGGKLACLATPFAKVCGGPGQAADAAMIWMDRAAAAGFLPLAPAYLAFEAGRDVPEPEKVLRYADLVIVPPVPSWQRSACVWRTVCLALRDQKPVYVLDGGADADA
ncbi:hypothetical protein K3722_07410 [Leisingera caerulea]|uniref:Uncharacterized protein n=1 Tax=Leisingera caerulea TaxID=506591 RepID=A0ABY5X0D8_LEICA|nr:hypothetical protein [Leisingera caerulea]UWQ59949.1 hypothetical protein K3722_07410 [Leisingera caerulea]